MKVMLLKDLLPNELTFHHKRQNLLEENSHSTRISLLSEKIQDQYPSEASGTFTIFHFSRVSTCIEHRHIWQTEFTGTVRLKRGVVKHSWESTVEECTCWRSASILQPFFSWILLFIHSWSREAFPDIYVCRLYANSVSSWFWKRMYWISSKGREPLKSCALEEKKQAKK